MIAKSKPLECKGIAIVERFSLFVINSFLTSSDDSRLAFARNLRNRLYKKTEITLHNKANTKSINDQVILLSFIF